MNASSQNWKETLLILVIALFPAFSQAQTKPVKPVEQANQATQKMLDESQKLNQQVQQGSDNLKGAVNNVKAIVQIFDPIFNLHNKRKRATDATTAPIAQGWEQPSGVSVDSSMAAAQQNDAGLPPSAQVEYAPNDGSAILMEPESPVYNPDGSANLGNQNHNQFGCYIDILTGTIMDDIDAAGQTANVDLIFTATDYYGSAPMYAFLTPAYVKNDLFANYYFRGVKYKDQNIPVRLWEDVNESEVAMTALTPQQFEKIRDNNQLMAVVKQVPGFKEKVESRTKIAGKVIAVKTRMANREAYGLILIEDQFGTTGANGYLKIKLKVTGLDGNGDGIPDSGLYQVRY